MTHLNSGSNCKATENEYENINTIQMNANKLKPETKIFENELHTLIRKDCLHLVILPNSNLITLVNVFLEGPCTSL